MRYILSIVFLFVSVFFHPADAQSLKLGHVNITKVLESLPDYQAAEKKLQEFAMQLQKELESMQKDYEKNVQEFYNTEKDMLPAIKEAKAQAIKDLEIRIAKLQASSDDQLTQKQVELLKPLEEKVMNAIKGIAAEKGYSYVFDSSIGSNLLYYPATDDITDMVKAKLGVQ
ncbi:MAG TPA: OmpH family outer membrane protein [Chitinophagales bacterium]|nr:OmpH family outer membrane protein [Chitinophagales bacterium]